jgi:hypothetical protein
MKKVRIGHATAYARDRFTHATDLISRGNINYICFETMSEVTMSSTKVASFGKKNPRQFDPNLEARIRPILKDCMEKSIKIISNQGWMDPVGAAECVAEIAREQGVKCKIAAVYNSADVMKVLFEKDLEFQDIHKRISDYDPATVLSAEVYFGADGIKEALENGANVVLTTRIVDSALYLGPLSYEFGWDLNDVELAAKGSIIGHLMECGCQVTGGTFADPGYKEVEDLGHLGAHIIEVTEEYVHLMKVPGSGGQVSPDSVSEQLLYEITDPTQYILPNVTIDFSHLRLRQVEKDVVEITGFAGKPRPEKLKVLVGFMEGYMNEQMVAWNGPGAMERAELCKEVLKTRFDVVGFHPQEFRCDYVGINAVAREVTPASAQTFTPWEVILRIVCKDKSADMCNLLKSEVDSLANNGPSFSGKVGTFGAQTRAVIGMQSALMNRSDACETVAYIET